MAASQSTQRRSDLALVEAEALAVNFLHDLRALERKLIALAPAAAAVTYADLRLLESGVECLRCELVEVRRATSTHRSNPTKGNTE